MSLKPSKSEGGYLSDRFLIATHSVSDGCFDKTVIYLSAHSEEGAMGFIVNMPLDAIGIKSLMEELDINYITQLPDYPIHFGGPVDTNQGFVLHSDDCQYKGTVAYESGICFSSGVTLLEEMASGSGPKDLIITLGCAGWSPGQLEEELAAGSWLIAPATPELLFNTASDKKWEATASSLGVDLDRLSYSVGHA